MSMNFSRSQLWHAFKHAGDFGVVGNANSKTLSKFGSAIERHVAGDSTVAIQGGMSRQGCNAFCRSQGRVERDEGFFWELSLGLENEWPAAEICA